MEKYQINTGFMINILDANIINRTIFIAIIITITYSVIQFKIFYKKNILKYQTNGNINHYICKKIVKIL